MLKDVMTRIGLTVNETKTKLREARTERFDFLGYTFGPYWDRRTGKRYLGAGPVGQEPATAQSQGACPHGSRQRAAGARGLRAAQHHVGRLAGVLRLRDAEPELCDINWYVANRVRHFLRRRHKVRSRGSRQFSTEYVLDIARSSSSVGNVAARRMPSREAVWRAGCGKSARPVR